MRNIQIIANDVEKVADYAECKITKVKKVRMNGTFSNKKLKELAKRIPKQYDKAAVQSFYEETGLKLKYLIFSDKFSHIECDRMGAHPDNDKWAMVKNGEMTVEEFSSHSEYLEAVEQADILVIDKKSEYK
jgi:predicted ATPase